MSDQAPQAQPAAPQGGYEPLPLGKAKERLRTAREARRPYEPGWFMNLAFYQGQQWVAHDGHGLYTPKARKGQVRLTDNRVRPAVRAEVSRLTKERPGWAATPDGADDNAVNSAVASTRLLEWSYDHLNFSRRRHQAVNWSRICGAGFVKVTWDATYGKGTEVMIHPQTTADGDPHPYAGQAVQNPQTQQVLRRGEMPELEPMLDSKTVGNGDVCLAVRSPFDIFPDELATNLEDARWIFDESVRSPEYVKDHYGKTVKPDTAADVGIVESGFHSTALDGRKGEQAGVKVFEMWEPCSKSVPQGRHMVFTDQIVLYEGPNEYECLPYVMYPGIDVPGRFWPDAIVTDLRPVQARWNKMISQIAENLSRFGNPAMLVDALADVKYTGAVGEKIKANFAGGGAPPVQYLQPPSMPGYTFNFSEQILQALSSTQPGDASGGVVPPGVTAASAISLLQEQSDAFLAPDVEACEMAIAKTGQMVIELIARYYSTDRVIAITGPDGLIDIDTFRTHASFRVPRISVVPNSTRPRSLAAKQAGIRDMLNLMLQYGVPMQRAAMVKVLKDTQIGGVENLIGTTQADVNIAEREWVDFLRGVDPQVNEIDDDHMHIDVHQDSAKVQRFRQLPPERQQVWFEHIAEHKGAAVRKQQQDASMAAMAAGPPAAPGGPLTPGLPPGMPANIIQGQPSGNPLPADVQRPPEPPPQGPPGK